MKIKITVLLLISLGIFSINSFAIAATPSTATLEQEIKTLQTELAALEAKVNANQSENSVGITATVPEPTSISAASATTTQQHPNVVLAPYVGVDTYYNRRHVVVDNSYISSDYKLLRSRKAEVNAYKRAGQDYPDTTKLIFSGEVKTRTLYKSSYNSASYNTNFNLASAGLDTVVEANRWISGLMTFAYDPGDDGHANDINNSEVHLGQGFIVVGDLSTLPVYGSFGQMYVPFGQYTNDMASGRPTKKLGRILARAISLGYHSDNRKVKPYASIYGFQGATEIENNTSSGSGSSSASSDEINEYGSNLGLSFSQGKISALLGTSYTSNIAESMGMQGDGAANKQFFTGFAQNAHTENLAYRVPGLDVYNRLSYQAYSLFSEYTGATKAFDANDLSFDGSGAQPQAIDLQAIYAFNYGHPSTIALDYGQTWQALAIALPKKDYGATYSVAILQNTLISIEVLHNIGYSTGSTATGSSKPVNLNQVGSSYNSISFYLSLFF